MTTPKLYNHIMKHSRLNNLWCAIAVSSLACAMPAALAAQTEADATDEEIYELSPFEVVTSGDRGYLATNSTSATRTNLQIQRLPQSLMVIPQELLQDLNATTLFEAIEYAGGISQGSDQDTPNTVIIRGFQTDWPLRNGVKRVGAVLDAANIERVEVVKGPAAILYGQSGLSGVVNYQTKRPQQTLFGNLTQVVGSNSKYRTELDLNVPLDKDGRFLTRTVIAGEDSESYLEDFELDKWFFNSVFQWNVTDTISLTLDYEYLIENQTAPYSRLPRYQHPSDLNSNVRPYVFDSNWRAEGLDGVVPVGPSFNLSGKQHWRDFDIHSGSATLEWKITRDLVFKSVLYAHNARRDQFRVAAGFIDRDYRPPLILRDPSFTTVFVPQARYFQTGPYRPSYADASNKVYSVQNEVVWKVEGNGWNGQILLGQEYFRDERRNSTRSLLEDVTSPALHLRFPALPDSAFPPELDTYRDQLHTVWPFMPATVAEFDKPDIPVEYFKKHYYNEELNQAYGYYFAGQLSLLKERLQIMAGLRYDEFDNENRQANTNSGTPDTNYDNVTYLPYNYNTSNQVSPQIGASYEVLDGVRVFAVYSEGIFPNNNVLTIDGQIEPQTSEGVDLGTKLQLFDGMINATLAFYQVDRTGIPRDDDDPSTPYQVFGGLERSEGVEFDFVIEPVDGWQIFGGYTYTEAKVVSSSVALDEGSNLPYVPRNRFSALSKYTFRDGRLAGFHFGVGYIYQDEQQGVYGGNNSSFIVPDWWKIDMIFGYRTTIGGYDVSFDLKLENVTDEEYIANRLQGYGEPRSFDFKVNVRF